MPETPGPSLEQEVIQLNPTGVGEQIAKASQAAVKAQEHSNLNRTLIIAVLWVVVLGFVTLLVAVGAIFNDYLANKQATYQNLVNQINQQSGEIKILEKDVENLENKIDLLPSVLNNQIQNTSQQKATSSTGDNRN